MRLMNYLRLNKKTAKIAKDRLHIIIAQERGGQRLHSPDYLPLLRQEILDVIAKYTKVNQEHISVDFHRDGDNSILELNVILPEINAE